MNKKKPISSIKNARLNLVIKNEKILTPQQWDNLLVKLIKICSQSNLDDNVPQAYKFKDTLYLFSLFKQPEKHLLSDLISPSFLSLHSLGRIFNSEHRQMSQANFINRYVGSLKLFNLKGMLTNNIFDKCHQYWGSSYLSDCVSADLPDMLSTEPYAPMGKSKDYPMLSTELYSPMGISKDYLETEGIDLKLYTNEQYRAKTKCPIFCKELLTQKYKTIDREIFNNNFNILMKDTSLNIENSPTFKFFSQELNESEMKDKFLMEIKNKHYGQEFQQLLTVIRLENSLPNKGRDRKKIKL